LPADFYGYTDEKGDRYLGLKPFDQLTEEQKLAVTKGPYRCMPVHPTQLYASLGALVLTGVLYAFWRRIQRVAKAGLTGKFLASSGQTFALMFILYGVGRFCLELIRDDNPFGLNGLTVSQNLGLVMIVGGIVQMVVYGRMKPAPARTAAPRQGKTPAVA
jgi:phosphatidylglycerol:prolipoprotein diacylglycerol transferase